MAPLTEVRHAAAVRLFEAYVRWVWPLHRRLVLGRIARRCGRCAASERMTPLGKDGRCAPCSSGASAAPRREDAAARAALDDVLQEHQGRGRGEFDALCLFSGGKDSVYMIRRVRAEIPGLRLLAVTLDNGFMSAAARANVEDLRPRLGAPHEWVRPPRALYLKLFRYCLTHLNEEGGYGTLDFSDGEFLLDTARRLAADRGIPLILCGYSRYQVENGLKLRGFESPRERELSDRAETAGIPLKDMFGPEEIAQWWHGSRRAPEAVARLLFPLHAWDLDETEIVRQVRDWGLLNERRSSPAATNHRLIPVLGVVDVHRFGYSSFERELCRMIREGKADAGRWRHVFEFLEHAARTGLFVRPVVEEGLAELGLSLEDVGVRFG